MRLFCLVSALVLATSVVSAYDVLTVPTANQFKQGEIELAYYHAFLRTDDPEPEFMHVETLYVGVTDRLELDAHRYAIDNNETSIILIGNVKLFSESKDGADVVLGCKNMTATPTVDNPPFSPVNYRQLSADQSYFLCAVKTFQLSRQPAGPPFLRVHLSLGTPDWTIELAKRHQGFFGGVQYVITPHIGVSVFNDSRNIITGICYFPTESNLMIRAGAFGPEWLLGIAYMWTPRW
jgi:hypothetical protein